LISSFVAFLAALFPIFELLPSFVIPSFVRFCDFAFFIIDDEVEDEVLLAALELLFQSTIAR
jgi:hypothetical protein